MKFYRFRSRDEAEAETHHKIHLAMSISNTEQ